MKKSFENIEKTFLKKEILITGKDGREKNIHYFNFKRVIIDSNLNIDADSNIAHTSKYINTIIFTSQISIEKKKQKYNFLLDKGIHIEAVNNSKSGFVPDTEQKTKAKDASFKKNELKLDLKEILKILFIKYEITSLMLESGPGLLTSFLKEGLIDKYLFFIAPKIIGGNNPYSIFNELNIRKMSESIKLKFDKIKKIQNDLLIEAYPCLQE
ncbi:MAG: RibD family protein [Actinomycetota bacterium]|nr:RibD family protein [Actinomycetota bacterium]